MKRMLTVWLALLAALLPLRAQGEEWEITLPQGAQLCALEDAASLEAPEGLEPMYALMREGQSDSQVWVARMPHGRALASISRTDMGSEGSAQELLALWPRLAQALAPEALYVDEDESCAKIETRYGRQALVVHTSVVLDGDGMLMVELSGTAFYVGTELVEIWTACPAGPGYLYDDEARKEYNLDRTYLSAYLGGLTFEETATEGRAGTYEDPSGFFSIDLSAGFTVLDSASAQEDVQAAREAFCGLNAQGADALFDVWLADLDTSTLLLSADGSVAAQVIMQPGFPPFDLAELQAMSAEVEALLNTRFDEVTPLLTDGVAEVCGLSHANMGFWLRKGECGLYLDILATVDASNILREVDIFLVDGHDSASQYEAWHALLRTLQYNWPE